MLSIDCKKLLSRSQISITCLRPIAFQHKHLLVLLGYSFSSQCIILIPTPRPLLTLSASYLPSNLHHIPESSPRTSPDHMKFLLVWSLLPLNSDKRSNLKGLEDNRHLILESLLLQSSPMFCVPGDYVWKPLAKGNSLLPNEVQSLDSFGK